MKLGDFGLAKLHGPSDLALTQQGAVVGTPKFMSPEQCQSQVVDHRCDIYALGATYFALLTGRGPYEKGSAVKVLLAHCHEPTPDPRDFVANLPEACTRIITKALAKAPAERYQSAAEMLADVEAAVRLSEGASGGPMPGESNALFAALESLEGDNTEPALAPAPAAQRRRRRRSAWWSHPGGRAAVILGMAALLIGLSFGVMALVGAESSADDAGSIKAPGAHATMVPVSPVNPNTAAASGASHFQGTQDTTTASTLRPTEADHAAEREHQATALALGTATTLKASTVTAPQSAHDETSWLFLAFKPALELLNESSSQTSEHPSDAAGTSQQTTDGSLGSPSATMPPSETDDAGNDASLEPAQAVKDPLVEFGELREAAIEAVKSGDRQRLDIAASDLLKFHIEHRQATAPGLRRAADAARRLAEYYRPGIGRRAGLDEPSAGDERRPPPRDRRRPPPRRR